MSKIDVTLEKYQYRVDEKIVGKVTLYLDEPVIKAPKLLVRLIMTETVKSMNIPSLTKMSISSSKNTAHTYTFDLILGGEQEYSSGEYPFEMTIPTEAYPRGVQPMLQGGGMLGIGLGLLAKFSSLGQSVYAYAIEARLDIPWKFDLTKKVDITIG